MNDQDSFYHWKFAVAPCALLGVIINTWDLGFEGFFNILNVSTAAFDCRGGTVRGFVSVSMKVFRR